MSSPGFSLQKWYLDCVSESGDTMIGYAADLNWNILRLHYSSVLRTAGNSRVIAKTSLAGSSFPQQQGQQITWNSGALNLEGVWAAGGHPVQKVLFESEEGKVTWSCLHPRSQADIRIGQQEHFTGLGYAELLELTIKPWQLPLSELRWGRFHSATQTIIWIDWRGSRPLTLVIHNDKETGATVSDDRIVMNDGCELEFLEKEVLRTGPLVSTVLASIPGMSKVVPPSILHTHETKWRSRGRSQSPGQEPSTGWAIHEVVLFNQASA